MLAAGAALRLWSVRHGLPAVHNVDESVHFVSSAVQFFHGDYNPHYFLNPPAYSYLLHWDIRVQLRRDLAVRLRSTTSSAAGERDPTELYLIGRIVAGSMGVLAAALCTPSASGSTAPPPGSSRRR